MTTTKFLYENPALLKIGAMTLRYGQGELKSGPCAPRRG